MRCFSILLDRKKDVNYIFQSLDWTKMLTTSFNHFIELWVLFTSAHHKKRNTYFRLTELSDIQNYHLFSTSNIFSLSLSLDGYLTHWKIFYLHRGFKDRYKPGKFLNGKFINSYFLILSRTRVFSVQRHRVWWGLIDRNIGRAVNGLSVDNMSLHMCGCGLAQK